MLITILAWLLVMTIVAGGVAFYMLRRAEKRCRQLNERNIELSAKYCMNILLLDISRRNTHNLKEWADKLQPVIDTLTRHPNLNNKKLRRILNSACKSQYKNSAYEPHNRSARVLFHSILTTHYNNRREGFYPYQGALGLRNKEIYRERLQRAKQFRLVCKLKPETHADQS